MKRISDTTYRMLMRQGLRTKVIGPTKVHGMKKPGAADESARRQVAADREGHGGVGMGLNQGRVVSTRPLLKLIIGGRK